MKDGKMIEVRLSEMGFFPSLVATQKFSSIGRKENLFIVIKYLVELKFNAF